MRSALLAVALLVPLIGGSAHAQSAEQSARGLVEFLTYRSGRLLPAALAVAGCGTDADKAADRDAFRSLVGFREAALPAIDEALDQFMRDGHLLNFAYIVSAYALVRGPAAAFPRLWRMLNISAQDQALAVDDALALSFGLTSYVSSFLPLVPIIHCRPPQPRDALDRLILGWETDNRPWLETSLGPQSTVVLASIAANRTWASLRHEYWPGGAVGSPESLSRSHFLLEWPERRGFTGGPFAVGYRFEIPNAWSEPDAALREDADPSVTTPVLSTQFHSKSGRDCGRITLQFLRLPGGKESNGLTYLVNDSHLDELFRIIASCGSKD